ncbi:MAG: TMEM165/GDT1 family protein [Propionibacteriales bacterium]|jgi:putative Ca2+/H+ antiporter (TMEM165/GDT1 family)|nr:TMEM165/GDT1 family protein [Propionibacteriales bacterium]
MDWHLVLLSFGLIFPVELPDKTFVAALVLSTRYRPLAVWIGVGLAFGVQCLVAVTAGHAVSFLPDWVVQAVSTAMFLVGAIILFRAAPRADAQEREQEAEFARKAGAEQQGWDVVATSFVVLFAAEWGDLSQILTLNLVAKYGSPVSIFVGAWVALLTVSGLAVLGGRVLLRYMRLSLLHYIAAGVCLVFAVVGVVQVATG